MLQLVAAYGNLFFHCIPREARKKKQQFTEKLAMSFSKCCLPFYQFSNQLTQAVISSWSVTATFN